jgi:hypothetical protein
MKVLLADDDAIYRHTTKESLSNGAMTLSPPPTEPRLSIYFGESIPRPSPFWIG